MFHYYKVFGFYVCSNAPIPILIPSSFHEAEAAPESQKVKILFNQNPGEIDSYIRVASARNCDESGIPIVTLLRSADNLIWLFVHSDGTRFFLQEDGNCIWADWVAPMTFEDSVTHLVGSILAYVLHLKKVPVLHASAVSFQESAFAMIGPSGSGKSTLAAAFAHNGVSVLADDVLAIREEDGNKFFCESGYPYLRLWEDSSEMLLGSSTVLPLISANWEKRHLTLNPGTNFNKNSTLIGAIYILEGLSPDSRIQIEPLTAREALVSLLSNKYIVRALNQETPLREFDCFSKIARKIPVRRVRLPENRLLTESRDTIFRDFTALCRMPDMANL